MTDEDGHQQPYYRAKVPEQVFKQHWAQIKDLVEEGVQQGYIHPDDVVHLVPPEPKSGRFYGLVKNHVEPEQWSGPIPPLRPIVSASGSNTEGISHLVDEYSRGEVKNPGLKTLAMYYKIKKKKILLVLSILIPYL